MKRIVPIRDEVFEPTVADVPVVAPVVKPLNFSQLNKNSRFKSNRDRLEKDKLFAEFAALVKSDLEHYEGKYDHDMVIDICNLAEDFFVQFKQMGDIKKIAVVDVLKPFFNDDAELVGSLVEFIFPHIVKSSVYRRNKKKMLGIVSSIGNFFLPK